MSSVSLTYTLTNGTPADATQVQQNFVDLRDHVNSELVQRDGSVAMTGNLALPGDPSADAHAIRKAYLDGPYVHASGGSSTVLTVKDTWKTIDGWTTKTTKNLSGSTWTPSTGVFIAPKSGCYSVSLTAALDPEDNNNSALSIFRYRAATLAAGGTDASAAVQEHPLFVFCPYALGPVLSGTPYALNPMGNEFVQLNAHVVMFAESGQQIRAQVAIGGTQQMTSPRQFASNLTIAWLHG